MCVWVCVRACVRAYLFLRACDATPAQNGLDSAAVSLLLGEFQGLTTAEEVGVEDMMGKSIKVWKRSSSMQCIEP